ncbi:hypothetical protein PoHVEF18_004995 [Penicillium ochrochloron]
MLTGRLTDAAILLHLSLDDNNIRYAVIGGYAITHFGGNRQTNDIDCIAIASKQQIINAIDPQAGIAVISQHRDDYIGLSWSDRPDRSDPGKIHIHCSVYPGARFPNALFRFETHEVKGHTIGNGMAALRAAGSRSNFVDSVDLRWLVQRYAIEIKARRHKIHLVDVGRALQQHSNLENVFESLGIDIAKAKIAAKGPPRGVEDIPKGLFDSLADS